MNRSTFGLLALAGVLLSPTASYAQVSCTRQGLKAATDFYITMQTKGLGAARAEYFEATQTPSTSMGPLSIRLGYVENFAMISGGLMNKPMKIDQHRSLLDTARCDTFTEVLISDKSTPYALGTRLHVDRTLVSELEMVWTTTGYWGFDVDHYLKTSSTEDWGPLQSGNRDKRATLESVANAYMDALLAGKADVEPWGLPCKRTTADGSCQVGAPVRAVNIANRHYVVDETMGAVVVISTFGADPASGRIRTPDAHLFRVENGKVRFVHALTHLLQADQGK